MTVLNPKYPQLSSGDTIMYRYYVVKSSSKLLNFILNKQLFHLVQAHSVQSLLEHFPVPLDLQNKKKCYKSVATVARQNFNVC